MEWIFVKLTHAASCFLTTTFAILRTDFLTQNSIFYVLIAWIVVVVLAKASKLDKHGFEIKPYSPTYKNYNVQLVLTRFLGRTEKATRIFSNASVVAGFIMMGFAFW